MSDPGRRSDLRAALVAELLRVTGTPPGTHVHALGSDVGEEQLELGIHQLRALPTGIGYAEMMRRLRRPAWPDPRDDAR